MFHISLALRPASSSQAAVAPGPAVAAMAAGSAKTPEAAETPETARASEAAKAPRAPETAKVQIGIRYQNHRRTCPPVILCVRRITRFFHLSIPCKIWYTVSNYND